VIADLNDWRVFWLVMVRERCFCFRHCLMFFEKVLRYSRFAWVRYCTN
jgi:hypothetical protein